MKEYPKNRYNIAKNANGYNHLFGKVVLLIANDAATLSPLIMQLAQKGADIALVGQQLSREIVRHVKESVEALGRRFLFINSTDNLTASPEQLVQRVTANFGHLDVYIDLSAQTQDRPLFNKKVGITPNLATVTRN